MAIDCTGVVSADFGIVQACLAKKTALTERLNDDRQNVFAERHNPGP